MKTKHLRVFLSTVTVGLCGVSLVLTTVSGQGPTLTWPQWAQNPQHTGFLNVAGQPLNRILANIVYDPLVPDEQARNGGDLLAHYQTPLVEGNDVYMESKAGSYTVGSYASQTWQQNKFTWSGAQLNLVWTFPSDWVPPGGQADFWEPVYHAALANGFVYDPGAGGSIFKLDKSNGAAVKRIIPAQFLTPDGNLDDHIFTISPLTADSSGNVYYNALKLQSNGNFYHKDAVDSWLVKVAPNDTISLLSYTGLNPAAPSATDQCLSTFTDSQLPWPPSADAVPGKETCGLQRVGINVAPAIGPDGTIYVVTRGHFLIGSRNGFLVAINPNLTLKWATSLRNRFHDGCGVPASKGGLLSPNGQPGGCRDLGPIGNAQIYGNDPAQNTPGAGRVLDDESSTVTIAPDGSLFFGSYTRYNYAQGHLMHFMANGGYLGAYSFGWDVTPAIYQHDGTYSVVIKDNHYSGLGSYCNVDSVCPTDRTSTNPDSPEEFFVTQLSPNLTVEWKFKNRNTQSCVRNPDGSIKCVSDHPNSFEWCVNAPVIDNNGVVYANSEDGNLYAINQGGTLRQNIFQQLALGAAYTPASLGADGKIYTQNAGHLFVVGK
jgi:outer membrane protein assembly factor BamB